MSKIKLTREQAEEIELQKKELKRKDIVTRRILTVPTTTKRHEVFHSIELEELIRALYIGYEVEETFEVGDWVVNAKGTIGKITNINEFGVFEGFWENTEMFCEKDNFVRHATPEEIAEEKQRRWWAKHGRDV